MKKIGELPAITDVPAESLLIVNTENGTKKITYEDLCQAVKATLGIPTVVQSIDITEPGNIPDGPVIKAAFDSVNDLLLGAATYSAGKEIGNVLGGTPGKDQDRGFFRIAYRGL